MSIQRDSPPRRPMVDHQSGLDDSSIASRPEIIDLTSSTSYWVDLFKIDY